MPHHRTAAPKGTGQYEPSQHSPHYVRTNWDVMLHLAQLSLWAWIWNFRMSAGIVCSPFRTWSVQRGRLCCPWKFWLSLCRVSLLFFYPVHAGNEISLDYWLMFSERCRRNAGSLHSEEWISPNQMPCLIRAVDTDNAVTGAGAIYLGLMSTDKSAGWDCRFGQLNLQTAHYGREHYHHFSAQQFSRSASMHVAHWQKCKDVEGLSWSLLSMIWPWVCW